MEDATTQAILILIIHNKCIRILIMFGLSKASTLIQQWECLTFTKIDMWGRQYSYIPGNPMGIPKII